MGGGGEEAGSEYTPLPGPPPPPILVTLTPGPARITSVHTPCSSCYTLGNFGGVGGLPTQRPRALGAPRAPGAHALGMRACCPPPWF